LGPSGGDDKDSEIRRLKRELTRVTEERDILNKATAYFARDAKVDCIAYNDDGKILLFDCSRTQSASTLGERLRQETTARFRRYKKI
jgi:hypothetical protein